VAVDRVDGRRRTRRHRGTTPPTELIEHPVGSAKIESREGIALQVVEGRFMKPRSFVLLLVLMMLWPLGARASAPALCVSTPRVPTNPAFTAQEQAFGFHDEELVLCSPGAASPVQIAARLWVPKGCPARGCAGVVMAHGFGFSKELTFADMYTAVRRGLYVLSYDVRGQGASGGQAELLGRDDIADQAAVLSWWHAHVHPTKTAFYGISQGGWLSWTAAIYNCGAARAAHYDSHIPCDKGGRWIDAIAPMQGPTQSIDDHTCTEFAIEAFAESRGNRGIAQSLEPCLTDGRPDPIPGAFVDVAHRLDRIDVPVYAVTSFYDRLVPARQVTAAYERLHARTLDQGDTLFGKDVRLMLSNDGHGDVGGNSAVTGDVFSWIEHEIAGGPPLRDAIVSIAQEWAGNTFRLEQAWPIPGTTTRTLYLARASAGELGSAPSGPPDELRNLPVLASGPGLPFAGTVVQPDNTKDARDTRLVYATPAFTTTTEITGEPTATIYVSSTNAQSEGTGQLNIGLSELAPDGSAHEFSHARIGLTRLGPTPVAVHIPLSIASHRIDVGNKLLLVITPSDITLALPAPGTDPFSIHHDARAPSAISLPIVPIDRTIPAGTPPSGVSYTDDPLGAICAVLALPC
jgi:predicted acyl esterase